MFTEYSKAITKNALLIDHFLRMTFPVKGGQVGGQVDLLTERQKEVLDLIIFEYTSLLQLFPSGYNFKHISITWSIWASLLPLWNDPLGTYFISILSVSLILITPDHYNDFGQKRIWITPLKAIIFWFSWFWIFRIITSFPGFFGKAAKY